MAEFLKTMKSSPADAGAALPRISCLALIVMGTEDPDWADPHGLRPKRSSPRCPPDSAASR